MLRFRANIKLSSGKSRGSDKFEKLPGVSLTGYMTRRDEFTPIFTNPEPLKKITPSMVKLPNSKKHSAEKPYKSTSDLTTSTSNAINVQSSTPNIPQLTNKQPTNNQIKEQKKIEKQRLAQEKFLEKKRLAEQKSLEKRRLAEEKQLEQQRKKEEKLNRERERRTQNVQQASVRNQNVQKRLAPQPMISPTVSQSTRNVVTSTPKPQPIPKAPVGYSTNTLESSISRSSGPPPYSPPNAQPCDSDNTGNTSFASDQGSWDLITQHRQQINRPNVTKSVPKQTHLDLNYSAGNKSNDNSEA